LDTIDNVAIDNVAIDNKQKELMKVREKAPRYIQGYANDDCLYYSRL